MCRCETLWKIKNGIVKLAACREKFPLRLARIFGRFIRVSVKATKNYRRSVEPELCLFVWKILIMSRENKNATNQRRERYSAAKEGANLHLKL